ncbi:MAG TPA: FAD-binding oxidoreductase [Candidatus Saccharimonadales bacterium]|nr:FAD-binding oxidoreductase [Candidatus Saccharimonadales bacterium]
MTSAEVVIIGGGVIGASIAYHLTQRGIRDVLVLERDRLGSGSTSRNAGGIRLQFSTEINVRMSQRSLPALLRFEEEMGIDPLFSQVGYLFLITDEHDIEPFERSLALWRRLDVPAVRLEREQIPAIFPELAVDDVRFATFCEADGHADPNSILQGYVTRARAGGARFEEGALVTAIDQNGGRVTGVRCGDRQVACETVVDAAGAWAGQVAALAGVTVPIVPLRRQIFITNPVDGFDRDFPMTIEFSSGLYLHRDSGGVLLGMADPLDPVGFDDRVNWEFLPEVVERGLARLPLLERATIKTGWAGFYEDTPDKHAILGRAPGLDGFVCAAGFSGHGLMHAPATGELIAEVICGLPPSIDIAPLRLARFAEGDLVLEHNVI